jgi:predicted nucleic acid-binding protein
MTTVVDTNVIVALWDREDSLNMAAQRALDAARSRGSLVIPAPVYSELMAFGSRTEQFLDTFFDQTSIQIDWELTEAAWRLAGHAFQGYAARRRRQRELGPRRILADFVIGAYAAQHGYSLLTLDEGLYRAAFPELRILTA